MPRQPRRKSATNVYHCMIRGINKQDIFLDNQDYFKFKKEILRTKEFFSYKLYSYVLMPNHVHLEVVDENENLSVFMQSLQIAYSQYFNKKYNRIGHVFQDRFKSKCVGNDDYILNLARYIHRNPEEAGISKMTDYKWGSYSEYINNELKNCIVEREEFLKRFSNNKIEALKKFVEYSKTISTFKSSEELLEYEIKNKLTDYEVIYFIREILEIDNVQEIQNYNVKYRNEMIRKIKNMKGVTISQISRVLGISTKIIQRAIKERFQIGQKCPVENRPQPTPQKNK